MSHPTTGGIYTKVAGALLLLTIITVAISRIALGTLGNISVGILVAAIKASLVVLVFMHLKDERRWWAILVLFPLALVMIILFSNFPDTALNGGPEGEFTTPALREIPHDGKAGAPH